MYVADVCLYKSKQIALTKAGKEYSNLVFQDKTETIDSKIWGLSSPGVGNFEAMDYVYMDADVTVFQNVNQLNVKWIRKADEGEYISRGYLPVSSKDIGKMYEELASFIRLAKNPYLNRLASSYFIEGRAFAKDFQSHSVVKSVHHGFMGGLLEHTLSVAKLCDYYAGYYPGTNRDLLLTAAMFHDTGKAKELFVFPESDHTDDGQLLGHTMIGAKMVGERTRTIPGLPEKLVTELKYCILAHHGELEYGSLEKPALLEALVLNFADNTDVKMETMLETLHGAGDNREWPGYSRLMETNVRKTMELQRFG